MKDKILETIVRVDRDLMMLQKRCAAQKNISDERTKIFLDEMIKELQELRLNKAQGAAV
jgi:hypothetical protein